MKHLVVSLFALSMLAAPAASAQRGDSGVARDSSRRLAAGDSLYQRARKLVLEGSGDAGRALIDSLVTAATGTPAYADALYWRAALAATAADAERDYRRVIVEYPFSAHAGGALLALAQLEMARGDRAPAIDHLQRFLLQNQNDPDRIRAGIWLGRLLLDENQLAKGCAVLVRTRASLGEDAVEIRNQVDYYASRCAGVDTARARRVSVRQDSTRDTTSRPLERYTVQVAAYETRAPADQLKQRLAARGVASRIVEIKGRFRFRVRVGSYATESQAETAARDLRARGFEVFVTTTDVERASAGRP